MTRCDGIGFDWGAKLHEITAQFGYLLSAVTSMYLHVPPDESNSRYLAI